LLNIERGIKELNPPFYFGDIMCTIVSILALTILFMGLFILAIGISRWLGAREIRKMEKKK